MGAQHVGVGFEVDTGAGTPALGAFDLGHELVQLVELGRLGDGSALNGGEPKEGSIVEGASG